MQGFPVTPQNRVPMQDWDRAPWNRWTFQHVRELLPTAQISRGHAAPWELPLNLQNISNLQFIGENTEQHPQPLSIQQWLDSSYTDGFMVLHHGKVVFERYMNDMRAASVHLSQSMSKSVTASVASILMDRGLLDMNEAVTTYLPELENSAYKGATLQQVMDMTTGVGYVEDYEALDSDIAITDIACGWKPAPKDYDGPTCMWDQIIGLTTKVREHGASFQYRSIETDVLAHCMERVSQTRLAQLISHELWQPLGCEHDANITVDSAGYALACGGLSASLRDFARFGQMHLQQGYANGRQLVPKRWVDDIQNTDPSLFGPPYTLGTPNGAYRNQFWVEDTNRRAYMARGVFGQLVYIDPDNDMVCVKLSTWPEFTSVPRLRTSLNAFHKIALHLNP